MEGNRRGDRCGGGLPPPQRKTQVYLTSQWNVRTCCWREVYGEFPHHNYGSHLDGGVADDIIWQHCWRCLASQSSSWYATPTGAVGSRFTSILAVEWQGVIDRSWSSEISLVFTHVVLTKTLGVRRAREIRARITRQMDLWERGLHAGLVGYAKAEGAARKVRAASVGEEEEEAVAWSYHDTVLSGKLRQTVRRATDRQRGGASSRRTYAQKPGNRLQRSSGRSIRTCVSPLCKNLCVQPSRIMGRCWNGTPQLHGG